MVSKTQKAGKYTPKVVAEIVPVAAVVQEEEEEIEVTFETEADITQGLDSSDDETEPSTFKQIPQPDTIASNAAIVALTNDTLTTEKIKRRIKQKPKSSKPLVAGSIYLGRIPEGFQEREMKTYFGQFGEITRLRLSRNKKTGKSKHFAFVEFKSEDVARIVAETMNNYLIFGHILKCVVVPNDQLHADVYKGANKPFRKIPTQKVQRMKHNSTKTMESVKRGNERLVQKDEVKRMKLKEMGIEYQFPGYAGLTITE